MLRSVFAYLPPKRQPPPGALKAVLPLVLLALVMAACGGTATSSPTTASYNQAASGAGNAAAPTGSAGQPTLPNGTPVNAYLIRSLSVSLQVNKPLDAGQQITQDVFAADPQAQAAGEEINQQDDGSYTVTLTFAVSAQKYDAVKAYLGSFSTTYPAFKGTLTHEQEMVQNVTSQYVDLQSRLKNLRTEQQRLLQLLSQAQNLSDTLTIQDKLTDVEGQIEQIEGQINQLDSQTSYSMVTIDLTSAPTTPPPAPTQPWNPGQVLSGAASAMIAVLQIVVDILIWLLVFGVFWGPALVGFYLWRRAKQRRAGASTSTPVVSPQ